MLTVGLKEVAILGLAQRRKLVRHSSSHPCRHGTFLPSTVTTRQSQHRPRGELKNCTIYIIRKVCVIMTPTTKLNSRSESRSSKRPKRNRFCTATRKAAGTCAQTCPVGLVRPDFLPGLLSVTSIMASFSSSRDERSATNCTEDQELASFGEIPGRGRPGLAAILAELGSFAPVSNRWPRAIGSRWSTSQDRGRKGRLSSTPPPSEPCERISRTRLSGQWSYLQEG